MKINSIFAMLGAAAVLFASCKKEEVYTIKVTPETATVYTDEALPELSVVADPSSALSGKTVEYTSSAPEVVAVAEDGTLSFAVKDIAADQDVVITVKVGNQTATCKLTVKAQIGRYGILTLKGVSLQMLDRNVGAKAKTDIGNFYQWGKNTPVAANTDNVPNANFDPAWNEKSEGILDWTKEENQPCPLGWRIPNNDDMTNVRRLTDNIAMWDMDMCTKEEYQQGELLLESMELIATGKFQANKSEKYLPGASYFWTSHVEHAYETTLGVTLGIYENNLFPSYYKKNSWDIAVPIRCVRDVK